MAEPAAAEVTEEAEFDDKVARQKPAEYWVRVVHPCLAWTPGEYFARRVSFARACAKRVSVLAGQQLKAFVMN